MARFLLAFLLIIMVVQANQDISPMEVYWNSILPNSSMPGAIRSLIYPTVKSNRVQVRREILYVFVTYKPLPSPDFIRSNFFLEKDIYPGAKIKEGFSFNRTITGNAFVPLKEAHAIPFSSKNLHKILHHFSMAPNSEAAKQIENSLNNCEAPTMEGEKKFCATSLESLINNVINLFGTHDMHAISTVVNGTQQENMAYKIASLGQILAIQGRVVICHPEPSPQAIYYCHTSDAYKGYIVPLIGKNGSTVKAVAVCHRDSVNFNQWLLEVLNAPDDEAICHFLPEDHLLWFRSSLNSNV